MDKHCIEVDGNTINKDNGTIDIPRLKDAVEPMAAEIDKHTHKQRERMQIDIYQRMHRYIYRHIIINI